MTLTPCPKSTRSLALAAWLLIGRTGAIAASFGPPVDSQLDYHLANHRVPKWSHGALLVVEKDNASAVVLVLFDKSGRQSSNLIFTIPGAQTVGVYDWDRGLDGTVALCGWAIDSSGRSSSYVALISPGQGSTQVVRTSPYAPQRIAMTADGTFWTQGEEKSSINSNALLPEAASFRHFDNNGHLIGSAVPQSTIHVPLALAAGSGAVLSSSGSLVAWYSDREQRYLEIARDDRVTDFSVPLPVDKARVTGFAVVDDGTTFMSTQSPARPPNFSAYMLDKDRHVWAPVSELSQGFGFLYGAEGNMLVADAMSHTMIRFYSVIK